MSVAAERATISREVWGRNRWSGGHGGGDNITPSPPCTQRPPHLLQHLLQRGHRLLLAASRLERGTGWGTAPERHRSLPTTPEAPTPTVRAQESPDPGVPPGEREGGSDRGRIHPPQPAQPPGIAGEGSAGSAHRGGGGRLCRCPRVPSPAGRAPRVPSVSPRPPVPAALCCARRCRWRWSRGGG